MTEKQSQAAKAGHEREPEDIAPFGPKPEVTKDSPLPAAETERRRMLEEYAAKAHPKTGEDAAE